MSVTDEALALLDALEDREVAALGWGFVDGAFTEAEIREAAERVAGDPAAASRLIDELVEHCLLFELPFERGRYRTRFAETVRLLFTLRQLRPDMHWEDADHLVSDYRVFLRPRFYPDFRLTPDEVLRRAENSGRLPEAERRALRALLGSGAGERKLAGFQLESFQRLRQHLASGQSSGLIVAAGTGSGKTLAAYRAALVDDAARPAVHIDGVAQPSTGAHRVPPHLRR
jgi:hypothetical protein